MERLRRLFQAIFTVERLGEAPAPVARRAAESGPSRVAKVRSSLFSVEPLEELPEPPRKPRREARPPLRLFEIETLPPPPPAAPAPVKAPATRRPVFEQLEELAPLEHPAGEHGSLFKAVFGVESLSNETAGAPARSQSFLKWLFWPESLGSSTQSKQKR